MLVVGCLACLFDGRNRMSDKVTESRAIAYHFYAFHWLPEIGQQQIVVRRSPIRRFRISTQIGDERRRSDE
jgi:hypothetical protein